DEQIATAFLSGLVAATDRFSNNHTSARVMTMAAELMSAGANQQLIASKFEEASEVDNHEPEPEPAAPPIEEPQAPVVIEDSAPVGVAEMPQNLDGTTNLSE